MVESKYGDFLTLEPIPINKGNFDIIKPPPKKLIWIILILK